MFISLISADRRMRRNVLTRESQRAPVFICVLRGNWCFSRDTLLTLGARDGIFVERRITFSGR